MSSLKLGLVALITVFGMGASNGQLTVSSPFYSPLYSQFCERASLKTVLNACFPMAAQLTSNVFGKDLYSAAPVGQVATVGFDSPKTTYFSVVTGSAFSIICESSTTDVIDDKTLSIHPVSVNNVPLTLSAGKIPNGGGYLVGNGFSNAATVLYSGKVPVLCIWFPTTTGKAGTEAASLVRLLSDAGAEDGAQLAARLVANATLFTLI